MTSDENGTRQHEVTIREARADDFSFVSGLMSAALKDWYDGDHEAHAKRIFDAHMAGGKDLVGHFSAEQHMFILEVDEERAGMVHLVVKKQGTAKMSPLIVSPDFQKIPGLGSALLSHAEQFARERGSRQIYGTVAKQNSRAFGFFRRMGYSVAGESESHYKSDITEVMIYKRFDDPAPLDEQDRAGISVIEFSEDQHGAQVRALILAILAPQFNGVDDSWVDALYRGYDRRHTREPNAKYKLVFVAVARDGTVVGVAGCTPKKGEPIKLMPCVASSPAAFAALLIDIPYLLLKYGRKLYLHCVPTVAEIMVLQRLGWVLNAMMPAAYHPNFSTQQWSNNLEIDMKRNMRVKGRLLAQIKSGKKTLEVRAGYSSIRQIAAEDVIHFMSASDTCDVNVKAVRSYASIDAMMGAEDHRHMADGMTFDQVSKLLHDIYPPDKERLGIYVIEIERIRSARP